MSRPATIADLPKEHTLVKVGQFHFSKLAIRPEFAAPVIDLIIQFQNLGAVMTESYESLTIEVPASLREMEQALAGLQSNWDYNHKRYTNATDPESGTSYEGYQLDQLNDWAAENDLPSVDQAKEDKLKAAHAWMHEDREQKADADELQALRDKLAGK